MGFELSRLRKDLRPFKLHWFTRLRSTNDHAAVLRREKRLYAPAAVLAGHQTAGRGRGSNAWWSGRGSLTVTFVLPADGQRAAHHVPLLSGLAVRDAAVELTGGVPLSLKWPNDLLHDGRKVAGLLCERVDGVDLIGIGMNVDISAGDVPPPLRERVTSLNLICHRRVDLSDAVTTVARHLHRRLVNRDEQTFAAAVREYDRYHALVGRRVSVTHADGGYAGICDGLDSTGRLLLRDGRTIHRVIAGHVELRG